MSNSPKSEKQMTKEEMIERYETLATTYERELEKRQKLRNDKIHILEQIEIVKHEEKILKSQLKQKK